MRINRLIIGILLAVSAAWAGSLHAARATPALTELNTSPLHLRSAAALIVTQDTDKPLYTKNTRMQTPIASITKLMTAMVVLDAGLPLDEVLAISSEDLDLLRSTSSRLRVGGRFTRHELLQLALMSSENRAASALSRNYPGGFAAFVTAMNRKAAELGMTQSTFVDATGLNSGNVSTAEDLARMVKAAYGYPEIREMTTTESSTVSSGIRRRLVFKNTNTLATHPNWQTALSKTGYISEAGRCLVMQATIASQPVIIVLLDSAGKYTRIGDANRIKKWLESSRFGKQLFG